MTRLYFLLIILFLSQCEARINVEREIKRFVRPFGKVINDISSSVDKAIFVLKNAITM